MTDKLDLDVFAVLEAEHSATTKTDRQLLTTLFALGREVASVLDLDELLTKLPELIARITDFHAFAIYLLDDSRGDLRIACSKGYPPTSATMRRTRKRTPTAATTRTGSSTACGSGKATASTTSR